MKPEIANLAESFEAAMEASDSRYFGIRIECEPRTVGEILSNSWHPASECDWVEADTELDGACCFEVQASVSAAIRAALSYWPNPNGISLIGGQEKGDPEPAGGIPEDSAILIRQPRILAFAEL